MTWYSQKNIFILYILRSFETISPCELFAASVAFLTGVPSFDAFGEQSLQPRKIGNLGIDFGPGGFLVLVRFAFSCLMFIWSSRHPLAWKGICVNIRIMSMYHSTRASKELQIQSPPSEMDPRVKRASNTISPFWNGRLYPLHNTLKPPSFCKPILCVKGFLGVTRIAGMKQHLKNSSLTKVFFLSLGPRGVGRCL